MQVYLLLLETEDKSISNDERPNITKDWLENIKIFLVRKVLMSIITFSIFLIKMRL